MQPRLVVVGVWPPAVGSLKVLPQPPGLVLVAEDALCPRIVSGE